LVVLFLFSGLLSNHALKYFLKEWLHDVLANLFIQKMERSEMKISTRAQRLGTENAFVVLKEVNALIDSGADIINFCIGQPDFDTPDLIKQAAVKAINDGKTGYTESAGIPQLREAVAEYLSTTRDIDVTPESVVVASGAKPFIGYAILSVTDYGVGHEVLYPNSGFPIYESQIRVNGAIPVPYMLRERNAYRVDIDELEQKVNDRTRLLILNSPHNPTGGVLRKEDVEAIAEVIKRYEDLWVLSDEVYSRMVHDGAFESIASIPEMQERTILMDSISKTYAMTGWRIGFATNEYLAGLLARWITNTDSCAGHPNQYAALAALTGPQDDSERMMLSFKRRRDLIVKGVNAIRGVRCVVPGGAFYIWPNVTEACRCVGAEDAEDFRKQLLHDAGVAVLSDIHLGHKVEGDGEHIRFSYATSEANIREGLRRIREYINQ
jgi:aspartate/methionine/tyrosine aminotransferase